MKTMTVNDMKAAIDAAVEAGHGDLALMMDDGTGGVIAVSDLSIFTDPAIIGDSTPHAVVEPISVD